MKGPGGRLRDIRRVWECPQCHRRDQSSGDVVTRRCATCASSDPASQVWMRLVADMPDRPARVPVSTPVAEAPAETVPPLVTDGNQLVD